MHFYSNHIEKDTIQNNNQMSLQERDREYLWHPYTQHKTAQPNIAIIKGEGVLLWDENGKEYIDAIASWWVNPFGHSNKFIADRIYKQLTTLEHVLFGGFTHEPAILLADRLMPLLPDNQKKLFFSDNGSTAIEVAIKVALQFFYNKEEKKTKLIAFENAFHGDTFAAMAASGISFFTEAFQGALIEVIRIPVPTEGNEYKSYEALQEALRNNDVAAFLFEPLVQGAAGMIMYAAEALDKLITICKEHKVFAIADEVFTGFGKTGKNFASDYLTTKPDMICLSKALTGGTIPMAITTFTQEIFDGFYDDDVNKSLFHGHTFTANLTGCAASLASLELLQTKKTQDNIQRIHKKHLAFQQKIQTHSRVTTTRVLGVIFALDIKTETEETYYGILRNKLYDFFIERGIILRPVGNIIYIIPPYIISDTQLNTVYEAIELALNTI